MKRLIPALAIGLTLISAALPVHALSLERGQCHPDDQFSGHPRLTLSPAMQDARHIDRA